MTDEEAMALLDAAANGDDACSISGVGLRFMEWKFDAINKTHIHNIVYYINPNNQRFIRELRRDNVGEDE